MFDGLAWKRSQHEKVPTNFHHSSVHNNSTNCTFRCNETSEVKQYARIARDIQYTHNDTQIFQLTGCLANCDKYHYTARPRSEFDTYDDDTPSLAIKFIIPNGHNESKEQVKLIRFMKCQKLCPAS